MACAKGLKIGPHRETSVWGQSGELENGGCIAHGRILASSARLRVPSPALEKKPILAEDVLACYAQSSGCKCRAYLQLCGELGASLGA